MTTYTVYYGDGSSEDVSVGQFSHTYQHPEIYTVTVSASNIAGRATQLASVTILGELVLVLVLHGDQYMAAVV